MMTNKSNTQAEETEEFLVNGPNTLTQKLLINKVERALIQVGNYELVSFEIQGEQGPWPKLKLRVDTNEAPSITLAEIAQIHVSLTKQLKEMSYDVEVSSPGLDRPLTKASHFEAAINQKVKIQTKKQAYEGMLTAIDKASCTLQLASYREFDICWDIIIKANTVFQWGTQSPKSRRKK